MSKIDVYEQEDQTSHLRIAWKELNINLEDKHIGKGGFGQVYKTLYRNGHVAVKTFNAQKGKEDNVLNEMKFLHDLRSEYLVKFQGICFDYPLFPHRCLVMEYCEGGSLRERLDDREKFPKISLKTQMNWAKQISNGVYYLHYKGIIHGDLKGANILLDTLEDSADIKIADFGLAVEKDKSDGKLRGTRAWMAPELITEQKSSEKTDIYSLGTILWEIVTREHPFKGKNPDEIIRKITRGGREKLPPDCPQALSQAIKLCWDHDPNKRPQARQIGEFFEKELEKLPKETIPAIDEKKREPSPVMRISTVPDSDFQKGCDHYWCGQDSAALGYFRQSAKHNFPPAHLYLWLIYSEGEYGIMPNIHQATLHSEFIRKYEDWFKVLESTKDLEVIFYLGLRCEIKNEYDKAVIHYLSAAKQSFAKAQYRLGICSREGRGIEKNHVKMAQCYQVAAQQLAKAQYSYGSCYYNQVGVKKDIKKAFELFKRAAEHGHPIAQHQVARYYADEKSVVVQDKNLSSQFYLKAAKQGYASAQVEIGDCYWEGFGVVKNKETARYWYQLAAEQGNAARKDRLDSSLVPRSKNCNILFQSLPLKGLLLKNSKQEIPTALLGSGT